MTDSYEGGILYCSIVGHDTL